MHDDDTGNPSFSSFKIELIDEQVDEVDKEPVSVSLIVASINLKFDEFRNDEFEFELPHGTITLMSSKQTVTFIFYVWILVDE